MGEPVKRCPHGYMAWETYCDKCLKAELAAQRTEAQSARRVASSVSVELANVYQERDNIASLNSSLIAKIAEAMDRLCYTAGECDLVTACEHWVANFHETEARAKRAEAALKHEADCVEAAKAHIAELEAWKATCQEVDCYRVSDARAERAEAALSFYADERNWHTPPHCYSAAVSDCGTKARAALAPSPAGPDGKSLAVLYCMDRAEEDVKLLREALEGMIAAAEGRFDGNSHADIDALAKARAALAPSTAGQVTCWKHGGTDTCATCDCANRDPPPAGRDCGCEDASKCWGGSPGIKCRRPFPSPAGREG